MRFLLTLWLALSAVAAPPLFFAQNAAVTGPQLWTPADAGLTAYWLADDISGADGDPVSTWPDGVGSNNATASGSNRPTLDLAALNGKAAVVFDGVNDYFTLTSGISVTTYWTFSVFTRSSTGRAIIALATSSGGAPFGGHILSNDRAYMYDTGTGWIRQTSPRSDTGSIILVDVSNPFQLLLNGTELSPTVAFSPASSGSLSFIGRYGGSYCLGSLHFVACGIGAPTSDTIQKLEGWAAHYYGLTANLPGGHPYKTNPPYK